jgi:hypothetical protein
MGKQVLRFAQDDKFVGGLAVLGMTKRWCDFGGVNVERFMLAPQRLCHPERSEGSAVDRATAASLVVIA